MQYRMQAPYRREVTRQYLRLPMAWHQRHPTGQLLSNANSDVEAAWAPIAPLPMAVGTLAMMVIAVVQMLFTDLVMALVGLLVFPLVIVANIVYQRLPSPLITRVQALRAELSEVAHESFDGAMVVKTLGREAEETERFAAKAHQLRDRASAPAASAPPSTRSSRHCPASASSPCWRRRAAGQHGAADPGDVVTVAYLLTIVAFPIRSIGWLLGRVPAQRRRLRAGQPGARRHRQTPYGDRASPRDRRRRPARGRRTSATPTSRRPAAARRPRRSRSSPGARWRWWAPPPAARAR